MNKALSKKEKAEQFDKMLDIAEDEYSSSKDEIGQSLNASSQAKATTKPEHKPTVW